jgi:hypothetical protein
MSENPHSERRQHVRVGAVGRGLHACLLPSLAPLTVLDIGHGGFSMHCGDECVIGAVYDVQLSSAAHAPVMLAARAVYLMRISVSNRPAEYLVGLEFIESHAAQVQDTVDALIGSIETPTSS